MRSTIILCFIQGLVLIHQTQSAAPKSEILSLWNLLEVSACVLHYSPLVYNEYGCWCGFGGKYKPVDEIDSCCMIHDKCYGKAVSLKICPNILSVYLEPYHFKCNNRKAICNVHNTPCQSALCACDVAVAECWSKYPKPQKKPKCTQESEISKSILKQYQD